MSKKVKLTDATYQVEYGGRLPAGSVAEVPDEVAEHWVRRGLATAAPDSAKTYRQELREALAAERAEGGEQAPRTGHVTGRGRSSGGSHEGDDERRSEPRGGSGPRS